MKWLKNFRKALNAPPPGTEATMETMSNFTPRAQQVLALARKEADRMNHNFLGTEHLLLGLLKLGQGVAVNVLKARGADLDALREEIEKLVGTGPDQKIVGNIPYTPRVKKVIALAAKEAQQLHHTYLGTEHLLLGLLREGDGITSKVLRALDMDVEKTRQEILRELDPNFTPQAKDDFRNSFPKETTARQPDSESFQSPKMSEAKPGSIDASKRYDVYCAEQNGEMAVYRKALFKGVKKLFQTRAYDFTPEFIELEQADGQTIFIARTFVIKFCEHGVTPDAETLSPKKSGQM